MSKKSNNTFYIKYIWKKLTLSNYKKTFNIENFFNQETNFYKQRFKLNYLLCLMRGVNSNYEENIEFPSNRDQLF